VTLRLKFPDGSSHDYGVKTFNFLAHTVEELEERGLTILLPFYVLKLRRRLDKAGSAEEHAALAEEMSTVIGELMGAVERGEHAGMLDGDCEEFKEADVVLSEYLLTYSEEAAIKAREEGQREGKLDVAKNMLSLGMSVDDVAKYTRLPHSSLEQLA
jgi:predicted transposase YdaD